MTTNKPEVFRFHCHGQSAAYSCNKLADNSGEYVRLSDYEALQAECEKLREHLQNMIDQTTPLEPVPGDPKWSRRIQLDEVIEERDSLRVEREKLRKDAERYQSILSAVMREIPHGRDVGGNAPGHGHTVPGIWDEDNGALAGKECAWCKIWNEAISAIQGGG